MIETLYGRIFEINAAACTVILECKDGPYEPLSPADIKEKPDNC